MPDSTIEILFITDDKFAMPTCIAITSLVENVDRNYTYNIHIICKSVSVEKINLLYSLKNEFVNINIINNDTIIDETMNIKGVSVSTTALLKFEIPNILPNLNKILYLDGDIIIESTLVDLYNTNIINNYAAVVRDIPSKKFNRKYKKYGMDSNKDYFNSGMMLLNLDLLRTDNISKKLKEYRENGFNRYMDQDAFNIIFMNRVIYLGLEYNFIAQLTSTILNKDSLNNIKVHYEINLEKTFDEMIDGVQVIHYAGWKPWNFLDIFGSDRWYRYYKKSPYKDMELDRVCFHTYFTNKPLYKLYCFLIYVPKEIIKKFMR